MVDKLKIVPRVAATAKANGSKEEEKKGDESETKKVSLGKGHLSLESANVDDKTKVFLVVFRNLIGKTLF